MLIVVNGVKTKNLIKVGVLIWHKSNVAGEQFFRAICWHVAKKRSSWRRKFFSPDRELRPIEGGELDEFDATRIAVQVDCCVYTFWDAVFYYRIGARFLLYCNNLHILGIF